MSDWVFTTQKTPHLYLKQMILLCMSNLILSTLEAYIYEQLVIK